MFQRMKPRYTGLPFAVLLLLGLLVPTAVLAGNTHTEGGAVFEDAGVPETDGIAQVDVYWTGDSSDRASTTVGTMLSKMEERGQVTHRSDGRVNVYRARIRRDKVSRSMVKDLAQRLFAGDLTQMVAHLLDGCEAGHEELAELKKLIQQKEQELRDAE